MIAFLRSLPPRRRTATLLGWGLLIASPFLLLAAISLVTGHNAFATYPVWSDELDYWRNLFTWDAVGLRTGYNGMLEEFADFKRSKGLRDHIIRINTLEEEADQQFINSMRTLHTTCTDPIEIIVWREIFLYLEKCVDACEHVADTVESVVMKNS